MPINPTVLNRGGAVSPTVANWCCMLSQVVHECLMNGMALGRGGNSIGNTLNSNKNTSTVGTYQSLK